MRLLRWLIRWAIALFAIMTMSMVAWTFLWPQPDVRNMRPVHAIVCLGGGMSRDGTLGAPVLTRIERCVQLYEAGLAPSVVFTGGTATDDGITAAHQMGLYAASLGLPVDRIIEEGRAQSTLQNALFTLELVPDAQDFIIVTEAFHLPRSWMSFRWATWELGLKDRSFYLAMSEDVRRDPLSDAVNWTILARESMAIWFNAARAMAYSAAPLATIDWLH